MVESFFCVVVPFFSSLRDKLVLLFSLRFVVVVVLGFLFWYSRAFFNVLSLYFVLFVLGGVIPWSYTFLLRCFCFSCLFFLSVLLFVFCIYAGLVADFCCARYAASRSFLSLFRLYTFV